MTEYLAKVAWAAYPHKTGKPQRKQWLATLCNQLKHEPGTVHNLICEMEKFSRKKQLTRAIREDISSALSYFRKLSG